jgi:hypothetical protein
MELYQSLRPQTNQMAMDDQLSDEEAASAEAPAPAPASPSAMSKSSAPREMQRALAGAGAPRGDFSVSQGVSAAARGGQVGELFQYAIDKPVNLSRQQSAMLPILNQQVTGERYSLFNEGTDPKHPLNAVKLKNASALHLMQGPITVFDAGTYAGDAQITDLAPGAEQLVTYALDLDTEVQATAGSSPVSLVSVRITRGIFLYTSKAQQERIYEIKNNGTKNRTVLVEHPYQPEWTLTSPKEALERTRDAYRFAVPVSAGKSATLSVVQTRTLEQSIALSNLGSDQVALYVKNPVVTPAVKAALQKLVDLQQKAATTAAQRAGKEQRVSDIGNDQSRIRANMDRLSQSSDLYKRYVKTLSDEEDELAKLNDDIAKLRDAEAVQRKAVSDYIQTIEVS